MFMIFSPDHKVVGQKLSFSDFTNSLQIEAYHVKDHSLQINIHVVVGNCNGQIEGPFIRVFREKAYIDINGIYGMGS